MTLTTFVGVTTKEVVDMHSGLYEFISTDGHHVNLHEADLVTVSYVPGPVPTLTTTFKYDSEWVPDSLRATPFITLAFDNVRIIAWQEDADALAAMVTDPEAASCAGQTRLFDWEPPNVFHLLTFSLSLTFTADRAEVSVRSN